MGELAERQTPANMLANKGEAQCMDRLYNLWLWFQVSYLHFLQIFHFFLSFIVCCFLQRLIMLLKFNYRELIRRRSLRNYRKPFFVDKKILYAVLCFSHFSAGLWSGNLGRWILVRHEGRKTILLIKWLWNCECNEESKWA